MPFFYSILETLTTPAFYARVIDRSTGQIVWLLARFMIVMIVINALSLMPYSRDITTSAGQWIEKNLPPLTMTSSTLKTETETVFSYEGKIPTAGESTEPWLILIDTSSADYPSITETNKLALSVAVASTGLQVRAYKPPFPSSHDFPFKNMPDGKVDAKYIEENFTGPIKAILFMTGLFLIGFLILFYSGFINFFFIASTFALEKLTGSFLTLSDIIKISFCATIPAVLICSIYFWIRFFMVDIQLIFLLAYGIYFLLGTTSARRRRLMEILDKNAADEDER